MTNSESILDSTKKVLGLLDTDTTFDLDVIMHINSAFGELAQAGVGADTGFFIADNSTLWSQYISQLAYLPMVKQFIYMSVRLAFDPPSNSWGLDSIRKQLDQLGWRINVAVEHFNPPSNPLPETCVHQEDWFEEMFGHCPPPGSLTLYKVKAVTLGFTSTIMPDVSMANVFYLTMTDDCVINAPTGGADGQHITLEIVSNGHSVTWGNGWNFGSAGEPSLSPGGLEDIVSAIYKESKSEWRAGYSAGF
jgi:hypothetical protein